MDDKTKKEMISVVSQGIQEVVIPVIDDLLQESNQRFDKIEGHLDKIEGRLDRIEFKLDRVVDENIVTKNKVEDHDKQIRKLATRRSISV